MTIRSESTVAPTASHVCGMPLRTSVFIPMKSTHAAVTGRVTSTVVPGVRPAALSTWKDRVPAGT